MRKNVMVVQGDIEVPTEIIASSIQVIADGVKKMRAGRLTDKAIVLLLHHASGVSQRDIKNVIDHMEKLAATYLKKKP